MKSENLGKNDLIWLTENVIIQSDKPGQYSGRDQIVKMGYFIALS